MSRNMRIVVDLPLLEYNKLKALAGSDANLPHFIRKIVEDHMDTWAKKTNLSEERFPPETK